MKKLLQLPNGIRVVIMPYERAMDVGLAIAMPAGPAYEPAALNGISHLLEHLMTLRCRRHRNFRERGLELDRLVTDFDAQTDQRTMVFLYETSARHFPAAVSLAKSMLTQPDLSRRSIDAELRLVTEEESRGFDSYEVTVVDSAIAALYQGATQGQPVLGSLAQLQKLPVRAIQKWHRQMVAGSRLVIAVFGNIDAELAEKVIRRNFSSLPEGIPAEAVISPTNHRKRVHLIRRRSSSVYLSVVFPSPFGFGHAKRIILSVIGNHLIGRESSQLYVRLVGERGIVYSLGNSVYHTPESGRMTITSSVQPEHILDALEIIFSEVAKLRNGQFSQEDLFLSVRSLKQTARNMRFQTTRQASFFAEQLLMTGDIVACESYIRQLNSLRVRDIRSMAKVVMRPDQAQVVLAGPLQPGIRRKVYGLLRRS